MESCSMKAVIFQHVDWTLLTFVYDFGIAPADGVIALGGGIPLTAQVTTPPG